MTLRQTRPRRARRKTDSHSRYSSFSLLHYLKIVHITEELCNEPTLVRVFLSSKVPSCHDLNIFMTILKWRSHSAHAFEFLPPFATSLSPKGKTLHPSKSAAFSLGFLCTAHWTSPADRVPPSPGASACDAFIPVPLG